MNHPCAALTVDHPGRRALGQGLIVLNVHPAARRHHTRRRLQCWQHQALAVRRVEKHEVQTVGRQTPHHVLGRRAQDLHRLGLQAALHLPQALSQAPIALNQQHPRRAARSGLKTERSTAREGIQAAPTCQVLSQPVEEGLAHPVGRRTQAWGVGHRQARASPLAANDAHLMRGVRGADSGASTGRRWATRAAGAGRCGLHWRTGMPSRASRALAWATVNSP